ncbi:MFS transporter [Ectobacillus funiculus]|uniref:MFS transporter n=1 Tax=Ectobacillus funiculus TaxID=137993 RepID=UPI00101BC538|nr:MFS transporter [Ectobacillus funiculus]
MTNQPTVQYGGLKQVFAVSLGLFLVFLDSTVVNIALPTIIEDYGITLSVASWIINAFVLTLAVLLVTFGKLADMFGRSRFFLIGLVIFTISSFFCGIAPNEEVLIVARVLQGIGGAMIIPASMMLVRTAVPPEKTGLAMGIWGAVGALAVAVGPSLGGVVTEYINWRWVFYINVPVVVLSYPFIRIAFKGHHDVRTPFSLDFWGIATLSAGLYFLTYAILQGEELGWTSQVIYLYFGISLVSALLFVLIERKVRQPLVDFTIFQNRHYVGGILSNFLGGVLLMGTLILLPIYFTQVKGYDTLQSSFLITPLSAVMLVVAPMIGRLIDRIGYFMPMVLGYIFTVAGFALLVNLDANVSLKHLVFVMIMLGTGLGIIMVTSVTVCTASVSDKHVSLGSGIFATSRNMGGAIGVSLFVSLTLSFLNTYSSEIVDKGITRFQKAELPSQVTEQAIARLEKQRSNFFEEAKKLGEFKISAELRQQTIVKKKQEVLQTLPQGAQLPPQAEKEIETKVDAELQSTEKEVNDIQGDIRDDAETYLVKAMTKAFWSGLVLAVVCSGSLLFLRKRAVDAALDTAVTE